MSFSEKPSQGLARLGQSGFPFWPDALNLMNMSMQNEIVAEFPGVLLIHQKIPGQEIGHHQHREHEFFLPLQGEITIEYEQSVVKAGPGRMLYVPPDLEHSYRSAARGSGERVIWLIEPKLWDPHVHDDFKPSSFPINSLAKELVFYLLLHQEAKGVKFFISALIETLEESLQAARLETTRLNSDHLSGKVNDERVVRAMQLIDLDLGERSLGEIAKRSGLSLRNFNRLFLQEAGLRPKEYLMLRRVEKAKSLLKGTNKTITDISLEVGYNSLSKFIGTFKRAEGILPSDYRLQVRKRPG